MKTAAPAADRPCRVRPSIFLLALPLLCGCASAGARAHNLGQLHDEEGRHRREGVLMNSFEYLVRSSLSQLFANTALGLQGKEPEVIKDPLARCLENLVELEDGDASDPGVRALQVEIFSRLAVEDPWELSREVCVRSLGELGVRLGVRAHARVQTPAQPASVDQVGSALGALTSAWLPLSLKGEHDGAVGEAAVAQVRALELDVQGGLRVLRALQALLRGKRDDARAQPLVSLEADLQRRQVQLALLAAWRDLPPRVMDGSHPGWPSALVRAQAVRSIVTVHGPSALAEYLGNLERVLEPQLMLALLEMVQRHGLPHEVPGIPQATLAQMREAWIDGIFDVAADHMDGQVRVAAMLALATISNGELRSLREEDWYAWIQARRSDAPSAPEDGATGEAVQGQGP